VKYRIVSACPVRTNGSSTGRAPIQVSSTTALVIVQNRAWFEG
jgi:hypothetical protein